jgi:tRNA pseudouridine55 synthase
MDGYLLVDKPAGWTSHDVVAKVRNILKKAQAADSLNVSHLDAVQESNENRASRISDTVKRDSQAAAAAMRQKPAGISGSAGKQGKAVRKIKVGHTGTLDPFATGLLVLMVGSYTKRAAEFSKLDKTYEAELILGSISSTGDVEGEITKYKGEGIGEREEHEPSLEEINKVLKSFLGEIEQVPHKFSAIKVDGQRAYKLARQGKEVKLEPRKVRVESLECREYNYPKLKIVTEVSSGTYIRSLAEDIGKNLGTGAYLSSLRRVTVGEYSVEESISIDKNIKDAIINNVRQTPPK